MKKIMAIAFVAVIVALAVGVSTGKEKAQEKRQKGPKNQSPDQIAWQEKLASMSPKEQQVAKAKHAFEMQVAPWREVRKLAQQEKATKTLAAIDKIIATKENQLKRRLDNLEKGESDKQPKEKKGSRQGKGKKKTAKD